MSLLVLNEVFLFGSNHGDIKTEYCVLFRDNSDSDWEICWIYLYRVSGRLLGIKTQGDNQGLFPQSLNSCKNEIKLSLQLICFATCVSNKVVKVYDCCSTILLKIEFYSIFYSSGNICSEIWTWRGIIVYRFK